MVDKNLHSLLLSLLLAVSIIQGSYREKYKFTGFDLTNIPDDYGVECVYTRPSAAIFSLISIGPESQKSILQTTQIPYPASYTEYHPKVNIIKPVCNICISSQIQTINPLISILYKNHSSHSSSEDEGPTKLFQS